jgi:hypothetical protein
MIGIIGIEGSGKGIGLEKSSKGTILRRASEKKFGKEIDSLHRKAQAKNRAEEVDIRDKDILALVGGLVNYNGGLGNGLGDEDDFYQHVADSVRCSQIRSLLQKVSFNIVLRLRGTSLMDYVV